MSLAPEAKAEIVSSIMEQVEGMLSGLPIEATDGVVCVALPGLSDEDAEEIMAALNAATAVEPPLGGILI